MSKLSARLDHLGVDSPNPEKLASFYASAMQMRTTPFGSGGIMCEGRERRMAFTPGQAKNLRYAALQLPSAAALQALRQHIQKSGTAIEPSPSPFFDDKAFSVLDPDGNRIVLGHDPQDRKRHPGLPARLQHLAFGTTDIQAMLAFYQDVLGLRISDNVYADDNSLRSSFLRAGNEHHIVAIFVAPQNSFDHHCYEAGDWGLIRDWADELSTHDIPLDWGPGRHGPGNNLFFMIRDPDNNWLEISAELEIVQEDRVTGSWIHQEKTLNSWGKAYLRS